MFLIEAIYRMHMTFQVIFNLINNLKILSNFDSKIIKIYVSIRS
jgi:hypothetical protein